MSSWACSVRQLELLRHAAPRRPVPRSTSRSRSTSTTSAAGIVGTVITHMTQTFAIPYRPPASLAGCNGDRGRRHQLPRPGQQHHLQLPVRDDAAGHGRSSASRPHHQRRPPERTRLSRRYQPDRRLNSGRSRASASPPRRRSAPGCRMTCPHTSFPAAARPWSATACGEHAHRTVATTSSANARRPITAN